ncbi:hypothetical protein MANES_11G037100v8 [Manihot esculenta]|uniref:Isochorismatase-like domain-containing protein n=1 Tax=Manihot esculenta TaxID=3983 RepID=A0A2C9UXV2_MANES|nr:hypothetical protein MANES_11G037100v8 [Manihot esculenta]
MADKWKETALCVIDMQNDFILEDGLMRVDGGKAIVPNVIKAVEIARQGGVFVVWGVPEHDPLGRDRQLFCRHLYKDAELVDGLLMKESDNKLVKARFSAFFFWYNHRCSNSKLHSQTVLDAVALNYQNVSVVVDATAAATPDIHVVIYS